MNKPTQDETNGKFADTRDEMERLTDEHYNSFSAIYATPTMGEIMANNTKHDPRDRNVTNLAHTFGHIK